MFKKIFISSFFILLTLPVVNAFAYGGGYLDDHIENRSLGPLAYDNNLDTREIIPYNNRSVNVANNLGGLTVTHIFYVSPNTAQTFPRYEFYDKDNKLLYTKTVATWESRYLVDIPDVENVNRIVFDKGQTSTKYDFYEFDFLAIDKYEPIGNLTERHTHESIELNWKNPTESTGTIIKVDGVEKANLEKGVSSFTINNLASGTTYNFEVFAKYGENLSKAVPITVKTDVLVIPPEEVKELNVTAKYNRVDLSWKLPSDEKFKHVNIYRDTITKTSFVDSLLGIEKVYAASTKIFETNGTYFNDLTVEPKTTYEYTLSTTSIEGLESDGISKTVTTPEQPLPVLEGGEYVEDEEGNYLYTWTSPNTGQVKVLIDGKEYKTVNASDLKILIPKDQMKFDFFGVPKVKLVPISEEGKEGTPVSPPPQGGGIGGMLDDIKVPITPKDLLGTTFQLLALISGFILLSLAFVFVPKMKKIIMRSFESKKETREVRQPRTSRKGG